MSSLEKHFPSLKRSIWKYFKVAFLTAFACLAVYTIAALAFSYWQELRAVSDAEEHIASLHCPDYYKTDAEVWGALDDFYAYFKIIHPDVTPNGWIAGRIDFYITHQCYSELEKYGYDGTSPITPEVRQSLIAGLTAYTDSYARIHP